MAYKRKTSRKRSYSTTSRSAPRRKSKGAPRRSTARGRRGGSQTIKIVLQHQPLQVDPAAQMARDLGLSVEPSQPRRAPF